VIGAVFTPALSSRLSKDAHPRGEVASRRKGCCRGTDFGNDLLGESTPRPVHLRQPLDCILVLVGRLAIFLVSWRSAAQGIATAPAPIFRSRRYTGLRSVQALSASHNCAAWRVSSDRPKQPKPPGWFLRQPALHMRRALAPSKFETRLDNLMWASFQKRLQLVLQSHVIACQLYLRPRSPFSKDAARHRGRTQSHSRATAASQTFGIGEILLRPRRPRLDCACARC